MNSDCSQGFVCGPDKVGGCLYHCDANKILLPNFATGSFECHDNSDQKHQCPGAFKINCDDDPIPELPLDWSQCDCDGQLWVSPDCRQAFNCRNGVQGDGYFLECTEPDQVISVDLRRWEWECQEDVGQCPEAFGGFKMGCEEGGIVSIPTTCHETDENPFGKCGCNKQVFISDDCTQAFECLDDPGHELDNDGCLYTCDKHETVVPDFYSGKFLCTKDIAIQGAVEKCNGAFKMHCEDDPIEIPPSPHDCKCEYQMWVSSDCKEAFTCRLNDDSDYNYGYYLACDPNETFRMSLRTLNWGCTRDTGNCPGLGGFTMFC